MEISFPKVFPTLLQLVLLHQFIFFFNDDGNTFLVIRIYYIFITIFRANCLLLFYTTRFDSFLRQHAYVFSVAYVSLFCFLFCFIMCLYISLSTRLRVYTSFRRAACVLATCFSLWLRICIVVMFLLLFDPFSRISDRGLFFFYHFTLQYSIIYSYIILLLYFRFSFFYYFVNYFVSRM